MLSHAIFCISRNGRGQGAGETSPTSGLTPGVMAGGLTEVGIVPCWPASALVFLAMT